MAVRYWVELYQSYVYEIYNCHAYFLFGRLVEINYPRHFDKFTFDAIEVLDFKTDYHVKIIDQTDNGFLP